MYSYLSVCQQQKLNKNAHSSEKSFSHLTAAAASEIKSTTYYQHLKKKNTPHCSHLTFFPLSNKATMLVNYPKMQGYLQWGPYNQNITGKGLKTTQ